MLLTYKKLIKTKVVNGDYYCPCCNENIKWSEDDLNYHNGFHAEMFICENCGAVSFLASIEDRKSICCSNNHYEDLIRDAQIVDGKVLHISYECSECDKETEYTMNLLTEEEMNEPESRETIVSGLSLLVKE